jgi:ABC-type cobalamin transport system ATPase subunit
MSGWDKSRTGWDKTRDGLLQSLAAGDLFHATGPEGAGTICLVASVTETVIEARGVISQQRFQFDRQTGIADTDTMPATYTIDSVAPFPMDIYNIFLGLERRARLKPDDDGFVPSDEEQRALDFAYPYYRENPV